MTYIVSSGALNTTPTNHCGMLVDAVWCRVVERGRVKCGQYWPEDEEGIEQYGSFAVINSGIQVEEHYSITSLLLQNLDVCTLGMLISCVKGKVATSDR